MNRKTPLAPKRPTLFVEALEPRIAPAALLNESKFTSVAVGGSLLLDASGAPGTFQGLTTGTGGGSGSYLLYLTAGRALVYTTDINGNGRLDPGEITGIALGKDSAGHDPALILFSDVNGDIATNLQGTTGSALTDSDNNPNNGRDGQRLTDAGIASITLRTLTASDIDPTIAGNTVANRLAFTSFSIHGNVYAGGDIGAVTIDTSGSILLANKFNGTVGDQKYVATTPSIGGLYTGTAANNDQFHFTQNNPFTPQVEGTIQSFHPAAGAHGGDISNVSADINTTSFSIGTIATGDGGANARGGNITNVTMHGDVGSYDLIAGNGGSGATGAQGGSIIGFSDLGTKTGDVTLHSGDGGTGLLGAGGVGGAVTFGSTNIAAGVHVLLGRGGDGFTNAGTGSSITSATFNTPEVTLPIGSKFYGTWHDIGDVGTTHPLADGTYAPQVVDFNGDGAGDGVFTTTSPDAVVVVFGNGQGGLVDNQGVFSSAAASETITLKTPGITNPVVTIGDFNGDGRPDIAVASGSASLGGVYVFLNQIGTANDPINASNFTHNPVGDKPFSVPLQTALPSLQAQGVFQSANSVLALVAGDFNGDGITDLAYAQTGTDEVSGKTVNVVGYLFGDAAKDPVTGATLQNAQTGRVVGSGYFYANTAAPKAAAALINTGAFLPQGNIVLEATSLTSKNLPDATTGLPGTGETLLFGQVGQKSVLGFTVPTNAAHVPAGFVLENAFGLGQVDTNRKPQTGNAANNSPTDLTLATFTVQDLNNDGVADIVVLGSSPQTFLVAYQGDGTGMFTFASGNTGDDQAGVYLDNEGPATTIVSFDSAGTGTFNGIGFLRFPGQSTSPVIEEITFPNFHPDDYNGSGRFFSVPTLTKDVPGLGLDAFYATAPTFATKANPNGLNLHPASGYGLLSPDNSDYRFSDLFIYGAAGNDPAAVPSSPSFQRYLTENGYEVLAGDGGNSVTGSGGTAGSVGLSGAASSAAGVAGAISIVFPQAQAYLGVAYLKGGNGGNGFGGGGDGGDVAGVTVTYISTTTLLTSQATLVAGDGGNGVSGDGGRGGNLGQLSIQTGITFQAGNAGNGLHGGAGGSITGNQTGAYDTFTSEVSLLTGKGGEGALGGGNGGNISGWNTAIANFQGTGGLLAFSTGNGGGAAGGTGGAGGSILNSSPSQTQNNLSGDLSLLTGTGGSGLLGGDGGSINNFINSPTNQGAVPAALTVITGSGGIGVSGTGGVGGLINNFRSNATGIIPTVDNSLAGLGRIIAGNGGASYGATGGVGGSVTNVVATTTSTPLFVAAGAGGEGLIAGGDGGSVTGSTLNSAAQQIGKLVVVSGRGGDALAARNEDISLAGDADTTDLAHAILAFGGTTGTGGNGGSITNLTQPVGAQTAVDLIAGDGGSTVNAGTPTSATNVGHGGSVTNVILTGTVGAISRDTSLGVVSNPPIKSYTYPGSASLNAPISGLVDYLSSADGLNYVLDDAAGNVGIVAGVAGRVRGDLPAQNGVNGDVTNVSATSILSIVAGSVDQVAPVRVVSGLRLTSPDGVLGADKSPTAPYGANGRLDYLDENGVDGTTLQPGYRLIDGAIFASSVQQTAGAPIRGPRVIIPGA